MQPSAIATPFPSTALPLHSPSVYNANQFPNIPNPLPAQVSNNNQPAVASSCLQSPAVSNFLQNCRLEIMVYDYDQFSVDECVGYCWLTLGRVKFPIMIFLRTGKRKKGMGRYLKIKTCVGRLTYLPNCTIRLLLICQIEILGRNYHSKLFLSNSDANLQFHF